MADDSPPEKRMRYILRSSANASNSVNAAKKVESKPKESRYTLRSTAKQNSVAIEPVEPPRKRKKRRNTPKQLMDLNDDCLLEMLEYLSVDDLCNLAESNQRLHGLAQYQFSRKYKVFNCTNLMNENDEPINLDEFERVLRIFGHHIASLKVSTSHFVYSVYISQLMISEILLLLILRYCGRNLKTLKLAEFTIRQEMDARCYEMFDRIEHVVLLSGGTDWSIVESFETLGLFGLNSDSD